MGGGLVIKRSGRHLREPSYKVLLKRIFEAPTTTSSKSLYLESGCMPIRFLIKARRIMFLHYLLNRNENELVLKVLNAQKEDPIKNDWFSTVTKDLNEFGLDFMNLDDIKTMKKEEFKKLVKEKCREISLAYLLEGNQEKSKMKNLKYYELSLQPYLTSNEITTRRKKYLFKFRTRMTNVGFNYGNKIKCPLCHIEDDEQGHLFKCIIIKLHNKDVYNMKDEKYEDIYSMNIEKLTNISKICESAIRTRNKLITCNLSSSIFSFIGEPSARCSLSTPVLQ